MFAHLASLGQIKTFEAAARQLSFKRAAQELHVTPTAVSHQIRALEAALGTQLFERGTRQISLTDDGKQLADTAFEALASLNTTLIDITKARHQLTINTTTAFAAIWLVPRLPSFNHQFPHIGLKVCTNDDLVDVEGDKNFDLAIRYGVYLPGRADHTFLTTDLQGFFATPNYWQQRQTRKTVTFVSTSLKNKHLPALNVSELIAIKLPQIVSIKPYQIVYLDDDNQTLQAALSGQGIALMSTLLAQHAVQKGWLEERALSSDAAVEALDYYAIIPTRHQENMNVRQFVQWLKGALCRS